MGETRVAIREEVVVPGTPTTTSADQTTSTRGRAAQNVTTGSGCDDAAFQSYQDAVVVILATGLEVQQPDPEPASFQSHQDAVVVIVAAGLEVQQQD